MDFGSPSDAPNLEELMQLGIRSAKAGNKDNARVLFQQVLDADKRNERAWLWMASVAENDIERRRYLETVLRLNPNNIKAHEYLDSLDAAVTRVEGSSMTLGLMILVMLIVILIITGVVISVASSAGSGVGFIVLLAGGILIGIIVISLIIFVLSRR